MVTNNSDNTYIVPTADNEVTQPSQPAFLAYLATDDADVTGDGTVFYLGDTDTGTTLTEVFDQSSDLVVGASGGAVFTAPATGRYYLQMGVNYKSAAASGMTQTFTLIFTSNRYYGNYDGPANVSYFDTVPLMFSTFADLDAADTAKFYTYAQGGTKTVDIDGAASRCTSWISGCLVV